MRELTEHRGDPFNERVAIRVEDPEDPKKAPCKYHVSLKGPAGLWEKLTTLKFQEGPLQEYVPGGILYRPPNGLSNEAILAIVLDRLAAFQRGELPHKDNDAAVGHLKKALASLQKRHADFNKSKG